MSCCEKPHAGLEEMIGAIEEILLRHRALVDDAIRPLQENTPIDDFLKDIEARVLALQEQEPSFWELRVVEYIHYVVKVELKTKLCLCAEDGAEKTLDADVAAVENQIETSAREQLRRLLDVLDDGEQPSQRGKPNKEHFLEAFWRNVTEFAEASSQSDTQDHDNDDFRDIDNDDDAAPDAMSYEAITFDELQFETGSVNSAPSTEELFTILEAFSDHRIEERKDSLHRLSQIAPIELVHCSSQFHPLFDGLLSLLLDEDLSISGGSMRLLYSILNHVEESMQFLAVYLSTVDMVGFSVTSGALSMETHELFSGSDEGNKTVNVFRLLLLLMNRVSHHWIHFPQEMLVRAVCSTFVVLVLEPATKGKKTFRALDVLAVLDAEARWLNKWTVKIPSREQLFTSIDECGLLSDIMYAMARVRPFESEMEDIEKMRVTNMLTILATLACYRPGRDMLFGWTKLPARMQQQRRMTSWRGLEKQFQLDTLSTENDRLYHFHRADREMHQATAMELEDCQPLEDQALEGTILSAIVIYLFESREAQWLELCALSACRAIRFLPARDGFLTLLLQLVIACSEIPAIASATNQDTPTEEREDGDPWFPFRRPRPADALLKLVLDSISKRIARGQLDYQSVQTRSVRMLESIFECAGSLDTLSASLVSALAKATRVRLTLSERSDKDGKLGLRINEGFFESLQRIVEAAPHTLTTLLFKHSTSVMPQLARQLSQTTDQAAREALHGLLLSLAQFTSAISELWSCDVWHECLQHSLARWRSVGVFDTRILPLLSIPQTTRAFFSNHDVLTELHEMRQTCKLDLDVALALNAPPQEVPYRLRRFSQSLAWLRAVFASQHTPSLFTTSDIDVTVIKFVEKAIACHKRGSCGASPQSEDACTMAFDMLTALAGCVPSMVGLYDSLLRSGLQSLEPDDDDSISACSLLVKSITSSLDHVGAGQEDWIRPKPLFAFDAHEGSVPQDAPPTGQRTTLTASMAAALDHMLASIAESNRTDVPLDLSMLSQATWELIGDIESNSSNSREECGCDAKLLACTLGKLIFEMAHSGRSKLGEVIRDGSIINEGSAAPVSPPVCFPTDAERKLMNRYYKDYCGRLGLKASPTTLHVLTKTFGKAAVDCFPITMLMILDQAYSEQDIIDVLQFCASCPSIFVLWPRVTELSTKSLVPADDALSTLLPLANAAEMVLEMEFPQVFKTLQQCHCSVLTLVLRWHSQCYWNFLAWDKLLIMVYLNFLYGAEFQVYLFALALKHMEPSFRSIITRNGSDSARAFTEVLQAPIVGFQFFTSRNWILRLRSTYHDRIRQILQQPTPHSQ